MFASLTDDRKISGNPRPVQQDCHDAFVLPLMLPKLGQSRVPPLTGSLQLQVSALSDLIPVELLNECETQSLSNLDGDLFCT